MSRLGCSGGLGSGGGDWRAGRLLACLRRQRLGGDVSVWKGGFECNDSKALIHERRKLLSDSTHCFLHCGNRNGREEGKTFSWYFDIEKGLLCRTKLESKA